MSRSSGSGKSGDNWKYRIYFDPEADKSRGDSYYIKDDKLLETLADLVDVNEKILNVTAYKTPLTSWQLTKALAYHMFIIFETEDWWWSIEKHTDGLTIQRSKQPAAVKERYRQNKRTAGLAGLSRMDTDKGRMSVHDLIKWLYSEDELNKEYDIDSSNCKHFATAVFNHVAKTKNL